MEWDFWTALLFVSLILFHSEVGAILINAQEGVGLGSELERPERASKRQRGELTVVYKQDIEKGLSCSSCAQQTPVRKRWRDRPVEPWLSTTGKVLDQFARDVSTSITYMSSLFAHPHDGKPTSSWAEKLEKEGKDRFLLANYSIAALNFC